eukprot:SAG22_NODE_684_length_7918_cov_6.380356_14_plen_196_part_00
MSETVPFLAVCLPVCPVLCVCVSVCLCVCVSVCLCVCVSVCLCVCLPACICLSVCPVSSVLSCLSCLSLARAGAAGGTLDRVPAQDPGSGPRPLVGGAGADYGTTAVLPFCCVSTVFVSKTVPFHAVCLFGMHTAAGRAAPVSSLQGTFCRASTLCLPFCLSVFLSKTVPFRAVCPVCPARQASGQARPGRGAGE